MGPLFTGQLRLLVLGSLWVFWVSLVTSIHSTDPTVLVAVVYPLRKQTLCSISHGTKPTCFTSLLVFKLATSVPDSLLDFQIQQ